MFTSHTPTNTWTGNVLAIPSDEVKCSSMHTFWTQSLHKCREMSNCALKMDAFPHDTSKWNQISTINFNEDHKPSSATCTDHLQPEAIQLSKTDTLCAEEYILYSHHIYFTNTSVHCLKIIILWYNFIVFISKGFTDRLAVLIKVCSYKSVLAALI